MRDIKFRGYNEINKKILNWNELLDTNLKNIFTMQKKDTGIILMQYTGLHDKNGKEIYEGDIVRKFNGIIGKVIYEHSEFIIDVTNNKKLDYGRLDLIENFIEVIGNIYDNPDLLEKGAEE